MPSNSNRAGSFGDKTFTAVWSDTIVYNITYILNGGTNNPANPSTYTIEDTPITIANPSRTGYAFLGWVEGNLIPEGAIGDRTFTATWRFLGENEDGDNNVFDPGGGNGNGFGGGNNPQGAGGNNGAPGTSDPSNPGAGGGSDPNSGNQNSQGKSGKETVTTSVNSGNQNGNSQGNGNSNTVSVTITIKDGSKEVAKATVTAQKNNSTQTFTVGAYTVLLDINNGGQVKSAKIVG